MTIYIDIVFLENFILNFIIILGTAILSNSKICFKKIALASFLGGIFTIVNYVVTIHRIINFLFKFMISIIMILISFKKINLKKRIEQIVFFYLVSFTFGGIAFMFISFINPQNIMIVKKHFSESYPLKMTIIAGIIGFIIIIIVAQINKYKANKKSIIYDLEIFYKGKNQKIKTMLDTGNLLKEPITKKDVIIVEKESLINIVSKDILENVSSIIKGKWLANDKEIIYNFMLIPFSTLGNENGLLIGFKPDYIKICIEDEYLITDAIIGIYDGKLSRSNLYTSLIGLDILNKEESKNEFFENI